MAISPGGPGLTGFIEAKGDGGDNWSYKSCQKSSQIVITNKLTPSFLQAGCPSCHSANSVKALKAKAIRRLLSLINNWV